MLELLPPRPSLPSGRRLLRWSTWLVVSIGFLWTSFIIFSPPSGDRFLYGDPPDLHPHFRLPPPPHPTSPRAQQVREAFVHAYLGYHVQAFPFDELLPVDGGKVNK